MCSDITNTTLQVTQTNQNSLNTRDICLIIISIIGVFLNGFLLCGVRLPKTCSDFVRNLALADLCTSFVSVLWVFRHMIFPNLFFYRLLLASSWTFVFISFLTLFAIAVQRYVSVAYALWTHSVMKNNLKILRTLSISTWFISIFFCSSGLFFIQWHIVTFTLTVIFQVLILSTILLYFMTFKSFRRYRFHDRHGQVSSESRFKLQLEKETKLTKTVFWVSGILIIGVLPYVILLQLNTTRRLFNILHALKGDKAFETAISYWVLMEMLAFSLNPVIYLARFQVDSSKLNRIRQRIFPRRTFRISPEGTEDAIQQTA